MEYKRNGNDLAVRLDPGEDIAEELLKIAEKEGLSAASVTGIGAADDFTVGVFDLDKKAYDEARYTGNHEITALSGSLTRKDGIPYAHLHITCAGKHGTVGGHLIKSRISLTAEIFLRVCEIGTDRTFDPSLGINRIRF